MFQEPDHIENTIILVFRHIQRLHLMYSEIGWVLVSSKTQAQPQIILDPGYLADYLSVSYDYDQFFNLIFLYRIQKKRVLFFVLNTCSIVILLLDFPMQDRSQCWQKKLLKVFAIDFLLMIVILFNVNEFGDVLAFTFKVTTDLVPLPSFFNVYGIFLKIILMILFFEFFYLRGYRITILKLLCLVALEVDHFHYNRV